MNGQLLILLHLALLFVAIPAFSAEPVHASKNPDPEEKSSRQETQASKDVTPPQTEEKPDRREILDKLKSTKKDGFLFDVRGEARKDLIQAYVQELAELPPEKREEAVLEFFGKLNFLDDLKDFFDASQRLPESVRLKNEETLLKLDPRDYLRVLHHFSKENQTKGVEKALPAARKDPALLRRLAFKASEVGYQFSKQDLEQFVFQQKESDPELLKQALKKIPKAGERLLGLVQDGDDPKTRLELMRGISSAITNGHLKLGSKELELMGNIVTDPSLAFPERKEAYQALEKHRTEAAQALIARLSKSEDPSELLTTAGLVGEDNPSRSALLNRVVASGDSKLLSRIAKDFPNYEPTLDGITSETLKSIVTWGLDDGTELAKKLLSRSLLSLAHSTGIEEVKPLVKLGLEKNKAGTLAFLDMLSEDKSKDFAAEAPQVMKEVLAQMEPRAIISGATYRLHGASFVGNFPKVVEANAEKLMESINGFWGGTALELLGATENSKYLKTFLENAANSDAAKSRGANSALGRLLKSHPELVTPSVEKDLKTVLGAIDEKDTQRLQIRQYLPEKLVRKVDREILEEAVQKQDPGRFDATVSQTQEAALQLFEKGKEAGLMGPGERALALQFLVASGHPEAQAKTEQFLKEVKTEGYIHNINAIQGLMGAAAEKGMKLSPEVLKDVRARLESDSARIWNSGNPEMTLRDGSNVIPYGAAALLTSAVEPSSLTPTQKEVLKRMTQMSEQVPAGSPLRLPYNFPKEGQPEEKDAGRDAAPTSGRDLTTRLALYQQAPNEKKAEAALALLDAAQTFVDHFSQTHEIPLKSERTHDRTAGSQQMALYYGFANDVSLAAALTALSRDKSLNASQREEAFQLSTEARNRLLMLTEYDGTVRKRQVESYPYENLVNQVFAGLTLKSLPLRPQQRILSQVK